MLWPILGVTEASISMMRHQTFLLRTTSSMARAGGASRSMAAIIILSRIISSTSAIFLLWVSIRISVAALVRIMEWRATFLPATSYMHRPTFNGICGGSTAPELKRASVTNNNYYGASGDNLNSGAIIDSSPVKANPNFTDAGAYGFTVSNPPMSCFTPIDMSSAGPRITRRP